MIVRKIRPEEYKRTQQFSAHAFEFAMQGSELTSQQLAERRVQQAARQEDLSWAEFWAAFEEDGRTMLSTLQAIPYRVNFDGHAVGMVGIGNVATLPPYRRRGGVRACFEAALPAMYEQGAAFSYLYPFSTAFYRKFGYELACERACYKLKLCNLPRVEVPGGCRLLEPGSGLAADIQKVDAVWQRRYNLMVLDGEVEYRWAERADPFRDREYTYVYYGASGEPKGAMTYRPVLDGADRALECTRFFFVDAEGFYGLLDLLLTQQADHSHVLLRLPAGFDLGGLLPEWSMDTVTCRREQAGMVRVVNAEQVLRLARMRGTGSLAIALTDGQIPQNNDCFAVQFAGGVVTQVRRGAPRADVTLPISLFSRLICGRCDADTFAFLPQLRMDCSPEQAAQVFYRKPMDIVRYF